MSRHLGILATTAAYFIWGASPLFWTRLQRIPALELLGWRVLFALLILSAAIMIRGRAGALRQALADPRTLIIASLSSICLMINWLLFVWSVTHGHIVDVSLGYYINPLMSVALGVLVLGESLRLGTRLAVGLAVLGVGVITFAVGHLPTIPLLLAASFAFYGLLKKQRGAAPPTEALAIESALAMVPLGGYLANLVLRGESVALTTPQDWVWLPFTGLITVAPLLLFGVAAQRTRLSTIGMLQFIAPSLQLIIGVLIYAEAVDPSEKIGFGLVWIAILLFAADMYQADSASRRELKSES